MSSGDREFDPDYIRHFQQLMEAELEYIEEQIIPILKNGTLSYEPAFGKGEKAQTKKGEYIESFTSIWTELQYVKSTIKQMNLELDGALEGHTYSEEANVLELGSLDTETPNIGDALNSPTPSESQGGDEIRH